MDMSQLLGGEGPSDPKEPAFEYDALCAFTPAQTNTAGVANPYMMISEVNGAVKLAVTDTGLTITALFDTVTVSFAEMSAVTLSDYVVSVNIQVPGTSQTGIYIFSQMGSWCEPFYTALCEAFATTVQKALFVDGNPSLTACGTYQYQEKTVQNAYGTSGMPYTAQTHQGIDTSISLFDNCVTLLPPNLDARRIPLCFVTGMNSGDYALTLNVGNLLAGQQQYRNETTYTISKLGYDTALFEEGITKGIRTIRERTLASVKEIDPSLASAQASQIAKLLPEGIAAPIGLLSQIAPSFVTAVEKKIAASRAAESYKAFSEFCDKALIHVGLRKKTAEEIAAEQAAMEATAAAATEAAQAADSSQSQPSQGLLGGLSGLSGVSDSTPQQPDPFMVWLIAFSPNGQFAAVEFAEDNSATYVYRIDNPGQTTADDNAAIFAAKLNRALEAIAFHRDIIRMTDAELCKPDNADCYMAVSRTPILSDIRARFSGRAIHSNPSAWKKKVLSLFQASESTTQQGAATSSSQSAASTGKPNHTPAFCGSCGAKLTPGMKFCGTCGAKCM
ncbi:MAG: zinc ribbon domain-containing protein [Clostridium sp.]|jgi:hypothetical protein|nr:zinc ribbon domain-containing protein [Clostridium sp.]